MNARQRKKAHDGRSPRLVERILGLPRGSCLDAVSFHDDKPRSYHGMRFTPTPPLPEYEETKPWIGLDGKQHRARRWRNANGEWEVRLDEKWQPPTTWEFWTREWEH